MTDAAAPRPRRTRRGAVIVGPTAWARYAPGALIGLPLLSIVLCPLTATGVQAWAGRVAHPATVPLAALARHGPAALLLAFLLTWAVLALWAWVPIAATTRPILLDETAGTISRRRGLRRREQRPLRDVRWAVGEAERGAVGRIGLGTDGADPRHEEWTVPDVAWDDASFDGLRTLQAAAGLRAAPPRAELAARARRLRQESAHREMAARIGMPWREEYAADTAAFRRDFDRARRVLGGKEREPERGDGHESAPARERR